MMENVEDSQNSNLMLNDGKGSEKSDLKTDFNENLSKDSFAPATGNNQDDVNDYEHTPNCYSDTSGPLQNSLDSKLNDTLIHQQQYIEGNSTRMKLLEETRKKLDQVNEELNIKIDKVIKQRDAAIKEKEAMVVRYAIGEKNVLVEKQQKESAEKKYKEILCENEILQHKYQMMVSEKARICQMFDNKCYEHKNILLELERVKSDLSSLETKLKWSQNSLKSEIEAHKECQSELESVNTKLQEVTNQIEQTKKDAEDSIKAFCTSQDNRAHILDNKLQDHQASLILLKHEKKDREERIKNLEIEVKRLQHKQNEWLQENSSLSLKVQQLEREKLDTNQKLCELRGYADQQRQDFADLQAKNVQLQQVKLQLKHEQDQLTSSTEQIIFLKQRNSELESDMESCRAREAELLLFTQQLTEKNVKLQSEFTSLETKVQQLSCEQALLKRQMKDKETKISLISGKLSEEKLKYTDILEKLNNDLLEKTRLCDQYKLEVVDQMGEKILAKRKFDMSMREVNKELQYLRKKLGQFESAESDNSSSNSSLNVNERPIEQELIKVNPEPTLISGHRIIDLQYVLSWALRLQGELSIICTFSRLEVVDEVRAGLTSLIVFQCVVCGHRIEKSTENPDNDKSEMNYGAVWGTLSTGSTYQHLKDFLGIMDIPCMSYRCFHSIEIELGDQWKSNLWMSMEKAGKEEKRLAIESGQVDSDGLPWTIVYCDGDWSHRSYGHSYNALSGVVVRPDTEIDKQTLIEHIVKLQRISAKKSEKIDFLEEHINTLVSELQKKTKLLQSYVLKEQCGTLTSNTMDKNKEKIAKLNGIMASMYSSRVADGNLTLELSLDINRKLQAVLEDVLIKNITLKESIDTLGTEIDRLNKLLKS